MSDQPHESEPSGFCLHSRDVHSELFLLPIITYPQDIDERENPSRDVKQSLAPALAQWSVPDQHITHFAPMAYDIMSSMEPAVIRMHLHRIHDRAGVRPVKVPVSRMDLPLGAPHLFFHIYCLSRKSCTPVLISPAPWVARKAIDICQYSLYLQSSANFVTQGAMPTVLEPDHFSASMLRGLLTWLTLLDEYGGIGAYSVSLSRDSDDVVDVQLILEEPHCRLSVPLRKYQLGFSGLVTLLHYLQKTYPNLDAPMDSPKTDGAPRSARGRRHYTDSCS